MGAPSRGLVSAAVAAVMLVSPPVALASPAPAADEPPPSTSDESVEGPAEPPDGADPAETPDGDDPAETPQGAEEPAELDGQTPLPDVEPDPEPPPPSPPPPLDSDTDDLDEALDQDEDEPFDDDYDPLRDSPEAATARRWLGAGIGATITGAVLVGGSIAMSQTAPCDSNAGNNCFDEARNRAAVTMGVPGGVLLLGGVAMTVIGALQKRRLRSELAVAPGPLGVVVSGRF